RRLRPDAGRLPRGLDVLHPVRLPHHLAAPRRGEAVGHRGPAPLLEPPVPAAAARLHRAVGPRGPVRLHRRDAGAAAGAPRGRPPLAVPGAELALRARRHELRRDVRGAVAGAALLEPRDRGAVLLALPAGAAARRPAGTG